MVNSIHSIRFDSILRPNRHSPLLPPLVLPDDGHHVGALLPSWLCLRNGLIDRSVFCPVTSTVGFDVGCLLIMKQDQSVKVLMF